MPIVRHELASPEFRELSLSQQLVVSRQQLAAARVHRRLVGARVAEGRWQVLGPYVVVLHPGPISRDQQMWVGVLHGGPDAVLCGSSALERAGLTGFTDDHISVCTPHGRHRSDLTRGLVCVRVHESRHLPEADISVLASPPRLKQDRATIETASTAASDRACRTVLAMSVQQRLTSPAGLRPLVLARPNLPRRALILETLDDVEGGSESLPELDYLRGLRRFGLPEPTRQRVVRRADGRYRLDAEFDPWSMTVEVNGAHHLEVRQKEYDDVRRTRLAIGGRLIVDIGSYLVRHDIELAVLLTADGLTSRGWVPPGSARQRLLDLAAVRYPAFTWTSRLAA